MHMLEWKDALVVRHPLRDEVIMPGTEENNAQYREPLECRSEIPYSAEIQQQ